MKNFRTASLADQVFEKLENDIVFGVYKRGELLTELKLAETLGVSRTPIREALRRLEQERLIQDTGKGSLVLGITRDDLLDIMQIRELDKLLYQMEHNYIQLEKKNYQFEYCGKMPGRIPSWVRANVSILKRPVSEDMIAFIYLSDISREKYEKLVMDKVVGTDYDYLALVDVELTDHIVVAGCDYSSMRECAAFR